ncbi:MAG: MCE family protein [Sphingomonadaceae bacterium]|nr:MCE family protein [Sphingomonadaceae bacterium]
METRANHIWVGVITLALLALLAAFIVWIARLNEGSQNEYDVFFRQSVAGVAKGSAVSYSGVPVGKVDIIELWNKDPSFVRVRISVDEDVPIVIGTTATIQGSFTGVSDIELEGGKKGAPPISEPGPEGVPVIPTKTGGLGAILSSAPLLLERLATLTESLNLLLSEENRRSVAGILRNTNSITADLSQAAPEMQKTLLNMQTALEQATVTLAKFEGVAVKTNELLGEEGSSLAVQLRETLGSAEAAMDELNKTLVDARPALQRVSTSTLPTVEAAIRDLRSTSRALRNVTEKIDERGAGAVLKGNGLPDYTP